jgi:hypothetical protein
MRMIAMRVGMIVCHLVAFVDRFPGTVAKSATANQIERETFAAWRRCLCEA